MSGVDWEEDDPFEEQREKVENPMKRLFREYGIRYKFQFLIGVVASTFSRILDLLPPIMLGVAIDAVFLGTVDYAEAFPVGTSLVGPIVPESQTGQFWLTVGIIGGAFLFSAGFHWLRNWGFNSFAQSIQHDVRTDTYDKM